MWFRSSEQDLFAWQAWHVGPVAAVKTEASATVSKPNAGSCDLTAERACGWDGAWRRCLLKHHLISVVIRDILTQQRCLCTVCGCAIKIMSDLKSCGFGSATVECNLSSLFGMV